MLRFEFVNKEEIPEDLESGVYEAPIVNAKIIESDFIIQVKFTGKKYDPENPSLLTMTKI